MARFTPLQIEGDEDLAAAASWLRAHLEQSVAARRMSDAVDWILETGRREAGPRGGPQLARLGYRICLVERSTGEQGTLACFIAADDIQDEEQRLVVEQVLALWLDRALDTA